MSHKKPHDGESVTAFERDQSTGEQDRCNPVVKTNCESGGWNQEEGLAYGQKNSDQRSKKTILSSGPAGVTPHAFSVRHEVQYLRTRWKRTFDVDDNPPCAVWLLLPDATIPRDFFAAFHRAHQTIRECEVAGCCDVTATWCP